jgi:hypothetical protein
MKNRNLIITLLSSIIVLALLNYGPMLYRRMTGNGGSWVEYYYYKATPEKLLGDLLQIKKDNKQLCVPNDTSLSIDQKEYVYIKFYHENKYYHSWVSTKSATDKSLFIFGGVSLTPSYDDAKLINRDMDYLTRQKTLSQFKQIVLNKLKNRPADT